MGFKTGYKESVVNVIADVTYDSTADALTIKDVGTFPVSKVAKLSIQEPRAARVNSSVGDTITFTSSAADTITVTVKFKSIQDAPGFENMLTSGRKELKTAFYAANAAGAVTAMVTALNGNAEAYGIALAEDGAGDTVTIKYNDPSVQIASISVEGEHGTTATIAASNATTLAPDMGRGTAKQLYESVRLGTGVNYKPFEHTAERQVNMNASYKTLSFDIVYSGPIGIDGINDVNSRRAEFILYIENSLFTQKLASTDAFNTFIDEYITLYTAQPAVPAGAGTAGQTLWLNNDLTAIYFDATHDLPVAFVA